MSLWSSRSPGPTPSRYQLNLARDRDRAKKDFLACYGFAALRSSGRRIQDCPIQWCQDGSQWYLEVEFAGEQMRHDFPFVRSRSSRTLSSSSSSRSTTPARKTLRTVKLGFLDGVTCPTPGCHTFVSGSGQPGTWQCLQCNEFFKVTE